MVKRVMVIFIAVIAVLSVNFSVSAKTITLKIQSHLIPIDAERGLGPFRDAVEKLSNGEIKIKIFGGSSLFPMKEVLEAVGNGALDMAEIAEGYWHKKIPVSEVAGMPFAFETLEEANVFMYKRGYAEMLKQEYAKFNVYHIPYESYPVGLMTNKSINTFSDVVGLKLRAYGVMAEWLTEMGASTTYIPGGELYTALATGVVDGAHWGDAYPMFIMKFQEVLKNYMLPDPIVGAWNNLIVNMDTWKKLTPVQQAIIEKAALAQGTLHSADTLILSEIARKDMKKDWKVNINTLSDEELKKMRDAAIVVWDKIAQKDPLNAKAIDMMKAFLKDIGRI